MRTALAQVDGWDIVSAGAYFAWVRHPFSGVSSGDLAQPLLRQAGVLALPGTMFAPPGDPQGAAHFRLAFANADAAGIAQMADRLAGFRP